MSTNAPSSNRQGRHSDRGFSLATLLRRPLGSLPGLIALTWLTSSPGVLLPSLLAVPSSGCCDCLGDGSFLNVGSATEMSRLDVSGDACSAALCTWTPDGECREFRVDLLRAGGCHLTATATDGRQASLDVTVTMEKTTCCGNVYTTGLQSQGAGDANTTIITFSGPTPDGGI
jgi:hypothetical protein